MIYLDSSALTKLIDAEPETPALFAYLERHPERVTSAIARAEVLRALRCAGAGERTRERASRVLEAVASIRVDDLALEPAAELEPRALGTIEAIHLATALSLHGLESFVTYDPRLASAAREAGLQVEAPGT
jgi:predicted nucleic acid-binding protein